MILEIEIKIISIINSNKGVAGYGPLSSCISSKLFSEVALDH